MNIEIYPRKVLKILVCFILVLLFFNIAALISRIYFNHNHVYGLVPLFVFDGERNIPTLYSSVALLCSSALLSIIAMAHKSRGSAYLAWLGLAMVFLFLAIDETAGIHEKLARPVSKSLTGSETMFHAWVIPYGAAVSFLAVVYVKFMLALPRDIMFLFIASGAIFIAGAIGFELLGVDSNDLMYAIFSTCEEFFEMLGIVVFIYTLLTYIPREFATFTIGVREPGAWSRGPNHFERAGAAAAGS